MGHREAGDSRTGMRLLESEIEHCVEMLKEERAKRRSCKVHARGV
jgi:hypothetical protein